MLKNTLILGRWIQTPVCYWNKPTSNTKHRQITYPGAHTSAASGDFEISIEIFDGTCGEETFHHQQNAVHKEGSCDAVDHVLKDVDPGGEKTKWFILITLIGWSAAMDSQGLRGLLEWKV